MPLLSSEDLKSMEAWRGECAKCRSRLAKNYCRQCDEFFHEHASRELLGSDAGDCPEARHGHEGHRTY